MSTGLMYNLINTNVTVCIYSTL